MREMQEIRAMIALFDYLVAVRLNIVIRSLLVISLSLPTVAGAASRNVVAFKIIPISTETCTSNLSLDLEAVFVNENDSAVEISPAGLGGGEWIFKYNNGKAQSLMRSVDDLNVEQIRAGKWIRIAPHSMAIFPFTQILSEGDSGFVKALNNQGLYAIAIEYAMFERIDSDHIEFRGIVESNRVLFLIGECSNVSSHAEAGGPPILVLPSFSDKNTRGLGVPVIDTILHESGHVDPQKPQ